MTQAFNLSQLANFVNSSGQLDASTGLTNTSSLGFPTGTLMLFQQTAAPTGWTKQTTHNNKALRVVSGTASSGGTSSFTDVFTNQTPTLTPSLSASATTLSTAQLASHNHGLYASASGSYTNPDDPNALLGYGTESGGGFWRNGSVNATLNSSIASNGSGTSHTHSVTGSVTSSVITLAVQYVDLIIASKN